MTWKNRIQDSFEKNTKECFSSLAVGEELTISLGGEHSDFVRFNRSRVRQATSVEQAQVTLSLQTATKLNKVAFPMTGDPQEDRRRFLFQLGRARQELTSLPDNPYPQALAETGVSHQDQEAPFPQAAFMMEQVSSELQNDDFVGYLAAGPIFRAIKNSKGTSHWYSQDLFFVDYSLYDETRAVSTNVAGQAWAEESWKNSLQDSRRFLERMKRPVREISKGDYRVYLAPGAIYDLLGTTSWGGFSYRDLKLGVNGLRKLFEGDKTLSPLVTLVENFELHVHPRFNALGEMAPLHTPLIKAGQPGQLLVNTRTASEYGVPANGAGEHESPRSLELKPGQISRDQILSKLGTGLYISNLHYLNWSDHQTARITGMTRYACFWVENGEMVSPIRDVRFDVSLYDILGANLLGLTDFQETLVNNLTYSSRGLGGQRVPGLLIDGFRFTL
ncbi:MAG: metallopeptidase TldD-related protein [Bdellovibrionales bacterium]